MLLISWPRRAAGLVLLSALATASPCAHAAVPAPPPGASSTLPDAPSSIYGLEAAPQTAGPPAAQDPAAPAGKPPGSAATQGDPSKEPGYDLHRAEHQRILGIMPEFQAVNNGGVVVPLTPSEKFHLMWKSSTDPFIFTLAAIVSGIGQAKDSNPGFHQGAEGYFKRFGASYADTFDGNFWGNAVLTVALKEDPRYFRKGEGYSAWNRALYSASTAVWTRRDNGKTGPNYANVLGNFISGGISNAYYPAADRGIGKTVTGAITVTAEGTIGSELIEFWPDISHRLFAKRYRKQMEQTKQNPAPPAGSGE